MSNIAEMMADPSMRGNMLLQLGTSMLANNRAGVSPAQAIGAGVGSIQQMMQNMKKTKMQEDLFALQKQQMDHKMQLAADQAQQTNMLRNYALGVDAPTPEGKTTPGLEGLTEADKLIISQASDPETIADVINAANKAPDIKQIREGQEYVTYEVARNGDRTEIGRSPIRADQDNGAMLAAMSNSIGRTVDSAFGGYMHPVTGKMMGMSGKESEALGVRAKAEQIYMDHYYKGTPITPATAVQMAMGAQAPAQQVAESEEDPAPDDDSGIGSWLEKLYPGVMAKE